MTAMPDAIDEADRQWAKVWPELDVSAGEVLARLQRLAHLVDARQADQLRRRSGRLVANRGDFDVLRALRRSGPPFRLAPSEIERQMLVSSAGLSGRLRRLEAEGWVSREKSPDDGRSTLVALTPEARAELDAYLVEHQAFEASMVRALSKAQRAGLVDALRTLLEDFEDATPDD